MPQNLKGKDAGKAVNGYWVKKASFVTDFKPKMQKFACMGRITNALKNKLTSDSAKKKAKEGLEYLKENIPKICSVVGEVTIMIEKDGHTLLSDVAPGDTNCKEYVDTIQGGIDKCLKPLL